MPERIFHPEFRDQNGPTPYPFMDYATLTASTGLQLARDTFIDAAVYAIGIQVGAYLTRISVGPARATVYVGDPLNKERASGEADFTNLSGVIALEDPY